MSEALWGFLGAIVGGILVGVFSMIQARISNKADTERQRKAFDQQIKQQREMFEYQSKENEKVFRREIIDKRIAACRLILGILNEASIGVADIRSARNDQETAQLSGELFDKLNELLKEIPFHSVFLDEKIIQEYKNVFDKILSRKDKELEELHKAVNSFHKMITGSLREEIDKLSGMQQ